MIKAVIFDCFGVLATEGFDNFKNSYLKGSDTKLAQANKVMNELNIGQIDYDEFLKKLSALAEVNQRVALDALNKNKPNLPLFNYIRSQLKAKYKIGLLSNAGDNWLDEMFASDDVALFDDIVLSYQHRMIKPDAPIFELAARRLGVRPNDCVFVDDKQKHALGAEATGMKAIIYKGFPSFKAELEKILAPDSDN
ncbi:MAG TPA: HAD-IA family hydrolase [Candidatus Saccharimonadales bacterium]|nr:HAD-IA family hydrolase [Candidatus Saccharimonadales bacterium]